MENSLVLLSTMSPRPRVHRKLPQKPPTKLALKRYIRKSSIFKNMKEDESIIVIESSTSSEYEQNDKNNVALLETSQNNKFDDDNDEDYDNAEETRAKYENIRLLSKRKYVEIEQWISDVNAKAQSQPCSKLVVQEESIETSKRNRDNEQTLLLPVIREKRKLPSSELSAYDHNPQLSDIEYSVDDKSTKSKLSLISDKASKLFDELLRKATALTDQSSKRTEELRKIETTFKYKDDSRPELEIVNNNKTKDTGRFDKISIPPPSTINSEQFSKRNEDCNKSDSSTELLVAESRRRSKKSSEFTSTVISISDSFNDDDNCDKSNDVVDLKNSFNQMNIIEDSFTVGLDKSLTTSIREKEKNLSYSSKERSEKDEFDLLDDLYGTKWRENKELVLSTNKPKLNKYNITNSLNVDRKISVTHKNPYLEQETMKSNKLLRSLQIQRTKVKIVESPWIGRLKDLCDSDTDSEKSVNSKKHLPKKLDFFDNSSSDVERDFVGKSSKINKSFEDDDDNKATTPRKNFGKIKSKSVDKNTYHKTTQESNNILESVYGSSKSDELVFVPQNNKKLTKEEKTYSFLASLSANVPITKCDMAARIFRNNFKTFRDELTNRLFKLYNEKIFMNAIPEDTKIQWSERMRGTAGVCSCIKTTRRTGAIERRVRITLATKVLDSADRLRDTLVHEMCHAATWMVSQVAGGHGPHWQSWTQKARITFPELPPIKRCHDYEIHSKYTYRCTNCGYSIARHTKSLDIERKRCGHCCGKFEVLINKTSRKGDKKTVPVQTKKPVSGFALFVKENYANFKSPQRKHGDVMKILGQKFTQMKVST